MSKHSARNVRTMPDGNAAHTLGPRPTRVTGVTSIAISRPALSIAPGDVVEVEAVTHHAGDAPDLMMDDDLRTLWAAIPAEQRAPGVHVMTGPIEVRGRVPATPSWCASST